MDERDESTEVVVPGCKAIISRFAACNGSHFVFVMLNGARVGETYSNHASDPLAWAAVILSRAALQRQRDIARLQDEVRELTESAEALAMHMGRRQ